MGHNAGLPCHDVRVRTSTRRPNSPRAGMHRPPLVLCLLWSVDHPPACLPAYLAQRPSSAAAQTGVRAKHKVTPQGRALHGRSQVYLDDATTTAGRVPPAVEPAERPAGSRQEAGSGSARRRALRACVCEMYVACAYVRMYVGSAPRRCS
jgi:hypothetical protein